MGGVGEKGGKRGQHIAACQFWLFGPMWLRCARRFHVPAPAGAVLSRWHRLLRRVLLELRRKLLSRFAGAYLAFWKERRRLL